MQCSIAAREIAMQAKTNIDALARQAGLDRALLLFPHDVAAAAASADDARRAIAETLPATLEPWPPARPAV
jgi:hypothetical protein